MSKIDSLLQKLPLLEIISSKKSIKSKVLNRIGIQNFRILLADLRYKTRPRHRSLAINEYINTLQQEGIVVIEDFLPAKMFQELEKDCLHSLETMPISRQRKDGPNLYTNINYSDLEGKYASIDNIFNYPLIAKLFSAAERRKIDLKKIVRLLSCLVQGENDGTVDPETNLHEDTFFNTHKAWLYISDVNLEQAPFVYVKGSQVHKNAKRYKYIYKHSTSKENLKSRRIPEKELAELGMVETQYISKKNTFVLANTLGFHRRMQGVQGNKRIALAFSARNNPFI